MPSKEPGKQNGQSSASGSPRGVLLMLATHLGRAEDMPLRSIQAIQTADLLIFEEDRPARSALKTAKVQRDYLKFSEHQQKETLKEARRYLVAGKTVSYMSDQGCPTFADPGAAILSLAYELGARIEVVPGPSSLTAALMACPFDLAQFYFAGFLPRQGEKRRFTLKQLSQRAEALVLMDTPYRLRALLEDCAQALGNRRAFLALDITGPKERFCLGNLTQLREQAGADKLNFVLIIKAS